MKCVGHVEGRMPCPQQDTSQLLVPGSSLVGCVCSQPLTAVTAPLHPHQRDLEFLPLLRAPNGHQIPAASSEMSLSPVVTPGMGSKAGQGVWVPRGCWNRCLSTQEGVILPTPTTAGSRRQPGPSKGMSQPFGIGVPRQEGRCPHMESSSLIIIRLIREAHGPVGW